MEQEGAAIELSDEEVRPVKGQVHDGKRTISDESSQPSVTSPAATNSNHDGSKGDSTTYTLH